MKSKNVINSVNDVVNIFPDLYGEINDYQITRYENLINRFHSEVGKYGYMASSSGRVEIVGNHTDHNGGPAVACSVSLDTLAMFLPTENNVITVKSEGYPDVVVDLNSDCEYKKGTSDALVKGVCEAYSSKGYKVGGFIACTTSNVSGGAGVSSSASFEVLICEILNFLYNDGKIDAKEKAIASKYAENVYFGKPCGLLDQSAIAFGGITYLDFKNKGDVEVQKINNNLPEHTLVLIETGGDHKNLTGEYASITDEMKSVANYFGKERLIEISEDDFYAAIPELNKIVCGRAIQRCIHFYDEVKRVNDCVKALNAADYNKFLGVVSSSGISSLTLLQNCCVPGEKQQLIPTALAVGKKYLNGGSNRVHGGGFAGTVLNVVKNSDVQNFVEKMSQIYGEGKVIPLKVRKVGTIVL